MASKPHVSYTAASPSVGAPLVRLTIRPESVLPFAYRRCRSATSSPQGLGRVITRWTGLRRIATSRLRCDATVASISFRFGSGGKLARRRVILWPPDPGRGRSQGSLRRRPDRCHQRLDADDVQYTCEIVSKDAECHLGGDLRQRLHQEVGGSHPRLDRAERVLDGLTPFPHFFRVLLEPALHGLEHVLVLPSRDAPLRTRRTLML